MHSLEQLDLNFEQTKKNLFAYWDTLYPVLGQLLEFESESNKNAQFFVRTPELSKI